VKLAIDVQYVDTTAYVAGVAFNKWHAKSATAEYSSTVENIAEYEPGSFYKRELPCILSLLKEHKLAPKTIVIDGYVYLDGKQAPGLGKKLFDALGAKTEIIGVAKKPFVNIGDDFALVRGESKKPLYVTSTGNVVAAISSIKGMHGANRIPVLLKRADQLCREIAKQSV